MLNKQKTATKALFLDRDGVINVNHGYVVEKEKFDFIDGIFELCLQARQAGYMIIVVTNQSGIARQYYDQAAFKTLTRWVTQQFWQRGIKLQATFHCPHHPKHSFSCTCRKPKAGMIFKAAKRYKIDLQNSIMIGDSLSDMKCAQRANIGTRVLFDPELARIKGSCHQSKLKPYYQARTLRSIKTLLQP